MKEQEGVNGLAEEYRTILDDVDSDSPEAVEKTLIRKCEWTPQAASHLTALATEYGAFMLRNALALSVAMGIEDGELGF